VRIADDPPVFEFQGHAGSAALQCALDALRAEGVQILNSEDWAVATHGQTLEAQALMDLPFAPTLQVAERLIDQSQGALGEALRRIADSGGGTTEIDALLDRGALGCRMLTGWTVALAGRPNVGKSSLLNAILGFGRAIVNPTAGTTRDQIRARSAVEGWPVELIDMAGIRESDDRIEQEGIRRAEASVARADVVVLVVDGSSPLDENDRQLLERLPAAIRVANKADLTSVWDAPADRFLNVSAKTGTGLPALLAELARRIVPHPPPPGCGIPFRTAQMARLHQLRTIISQGEKTPADLASWVASTNSIGVP
jgi:tRNA modification GTPase